MDVVVAIAHADGGGERGSVHCITFANHDWLTFARDQHIMLFVDDDTILRKYRNVAVVCRLAHTHQ